MNIDLAPLWKALAPLAKPLKALWAEHHLLTILCAFLTVMMTLSFYRFLKSINPGLVGFLLLLLFLILVLHWTITRTEPAFLKPAIDFIAPFFPASPYTTPPAPPMPKR